VRHTAIVAALGKTVGASQIACVRQVDVYRKVSAILKAATAQYIRILVGDQTSPLKK
jgi:hypothetical protein